MIITSLYTPGVTISASAQTIPPVGAGVNVNSQSKASAPHLSSHCIKYSCPEFTPASAINDPKVLGTSQPSSSFAISVNVSQPSVYTYSLVSIPAGSEAQELIPIVPSPSAT